GRIALCDSGRACEGGRCGRDDVGQRRRPGPYQRACRAHLLHRKGTQELLFERGYPGSAWRHELASRARYACVLALATAAAIAGFAAALLIPADRGARPEPVCSATCGPATPVAVSRSAPRDSFP